MKKIYLLTALIIANSGMFGQITFGYTGGVQSYTVPAGTSAVCFTVLGAQGQGNTFGNMGGGLGGQVIGTLPVVPGQVLQIYVGGGGISSNAGGFNGGANGGTVQCCAISNGGGGGGASDIRIAPYTLADRVAVGGGGGGTGGNRNVGCAPGCGGGGGGGWYGGGGGGAYGGSPGFGGTQVAGGAGGASCCGCPLTPLPGAAGTYGAGGLGGGMSACNNQAANNPGCTGGVGGALTGGQGPNCTGGTGCPSTWAGASGGGGSNYAAPAVTGVAHTAGVQSGNGLVLLNPNCCATPSIVIAASPTAVCAGQSTTLTGTGAGAGGTYTWQPGGLNTSTIAVTPSVTTTYTLMGTNATSCTGQATITVTVNPLPIVNPANNGPLCAGQTLSLSVGAGASYTWTGPNAFNSNVQNPTIVSSNTINAGVYTVSVTSAAGCVASGTTNVSISPPPVVTPTNTGPYCPGAAISLSVMAATSYSWSGPNAYVSNVQSPNIPNAQAINGGVYTVSVTIGSCMSVGTTTVVMNPAPSPTITVNNPVCVNQPVNFVGSGGTTYTWTGPGGFNATVSNTSIAVAQLTNSGIYTLAVSDANTCTNSTTVNLVVNPLPVVTTGNFTVCQNSPINLFSAGANTYTWTGPNAFTSTVQNAVVPVAQTGIQQYTVIGTSVAGCTAQAVSIVTAIALPVPTITSNAPVCFGTTLNLSASGGTVFNWAGPNSFTSALQNPTIQPAPLQATGVYTLIATMGACSGSTTASITVNPLPSPTITSNSPVCALKMLSFQAPAGNTYTWTGPSGFTANGNNASILSAGMLSAGIYTVTVTDGNNCTNTLFTSVVVNPLPTIVAKGSTVCAGSDFSLSATGGTSFVWSGPGGFNADTNKVQVQGASAGMTGQYTVTVTDNNGCVNSAFVYVQVNPIPSLTAGINSPICAYQTASFTSGPQNGSGYYWNGPNGFSSILQNPSISNVDMAGSGTYTVSITDNIGCSAKAIVQLVINPPPVMNITSDKKGGCVPVCITFGSQSTSSIVSCHWDLGDGSSIPSIQGLTKCFDHAGGYNITSEYVDANGCTNTSTYNVQAYPIPVADFNFSPSKPVTNDNIEFTDNSQNATIGGWTWSFSNIKNTVMIHPSVSMAYEEAGKYAVALIVTSDKGCKDTVVKEIVVGEDFGIYVPDAFSPNGDGLNDTFQAKGFGIVKFELNIFDRWGEKLFSTQDINKGWDGTKGGKGGDVIKDDVYVWSVKVTNVFGKEKEFSGKVTLTK